MTSRDTNQQGINQQGGYYFVNNPDHTRLSQCGSETSGIPNCPSGWVDTGMTQSCTFVDATGDLANDRYKFIGSQRVCVKPETSTSSVSFEVDCCAGGFGDSQQCRARGLTPYSDKCNNIMQSMCSTVHHEDPYSPENLTTGFIGVPRRVSTPITDPSVKSACKAYLASAPANSFYHNHGYRDYSRNFPRQNYTMPNFHGQWGYYPERAQYHRWDEFQWQHANVQCKTTPQSCWNTRSSPMEISERETCMRRQRGCGK